MKKQVVTLAALMIASNVAMAGSQMSADSIKSIVQAGEVLSAGTVKFSQDGSQLSVGAFNESVRLGGVSVRSTGAAISKATDATVDAAKSTSTKVSNAAVSTYNATVDSAKSTSGKISDGASWAKDKAVSSAQSTSQGISNAAEYTVETVKSAASRSGKMSTQVIEVTLVSLRDATKTTLTFSYNTSTAIGRDMVASAGSVLNATKTVIVATSNSGVVLVTESTNGVTAVLNGDIKAGSSTIIASASQSAKAFESEMVQGLSEKK